MWQRASNSQNQLHLKWLFVWRLKPYQFVPNSPIYLVTHLHTQLGQLAKSLSLPYPVRLSLQVNRHLGRTHNRSQCDSQDEYWPLVVDLSVHVSWYIVHLPILKLFSTTLLSYILHRYVVVWVVASVSPKPSSLCAHKSTQLRSTW